MAVRIDIETCLLLIACAAFLPHGATVAAIRDDLIGPSDSFSLDDETCLIQLGTQVEVHKHPTDTLALGATELARREVGYHSYASEGRAGPTAAQKAHERMAARAGSEARSSATWSPPDPPWMGTGPLDAQATDELKRTSLLPSVWACLGPLKPAEALTDPLNAYGGIESIAAQTPDALWQELRASAARGVAASTASDQFSPTLQASLEQFPSETGFGGRTLWAIAYTDTEGERVRVNYTKAGVAVGFDRPAFSDGGWAIGEVVLERDTVVLARCDGVFFVEGQTALLFPDIYDEHRAIHALHLKKGTTKLFVQATDGFWCDLYEDTNSSRQYLTRVPDRSDGRSPFVVLPDFQISDVVYGALASPYIAVPVLNVYGQPLVVQSVELPLGPSGLKISVANQSKVPIRPGQTFILRLEVSQTEELTCISDPSVNGVNVTVRLRPAAASDSSPLPAQDLRLIAGCPSAQGGYIVTFPDYDGSIQHMWVAPPNVSGLPGGACPDYGCPVLLSLHGADVSINWNWGHSYAMDGVEGSPFPYPAWLVQPSNRYHWGTDWQNQGYDDANAALEYVRTHQPGLPSEMRPQMRVDTEHLLVSGHSMGGHGCMVYSTHEPDRLLGTICASGWTSMARYGGSDGSVLEDRTVRGVNDAFQHEFAADFLSANLLGVPVMFVVGSNDDNVPPQESMYMASLVDAHAGNTSAVSVVELPGEGHWFGMHKPQMVDFIRDRLRPSSDPSAARLWSYPSLPRSFEFTAVNPFTFGTKGNLQLLQLLNPARPGRFYVLRCPGGECGTQLEEDALWRVETFNVQRFRFKPPSAGGHRLPGAILLDGQRFEGPALNGSAGQHFCLGRAPAGQERPAVWGLCGSNRRWESVQRGAPSAGGGPINMALRHAPVCIAHGSGSGQEQAALAIAEKLYFVSRYAVPVVNASPDATIPAEVQSACAAAHLLLVGHPDDNAWTQQHRCAFPYIHFLKGQRRGFVLAGQMYSEPHVGVLALGTLPERGRLALWVHGTDVMGLQVATKRVPISSWQDGADFFVFGPAAAWSGEGGILAAGYLDEKWQPSVSSWVEPVLSAAAPEVGSISAEESICVAQLQALHDSSQEIESIGAEESRAWSSAVDLVLTISVVLVSVSHGGW